MYRRHLDVAVAQTGLRGEKLRRGVGKSETRCARAHGLAPGDERSTSLIASCLAVWIDGCSRVFTDNRVFGGLRRGNNGKKKSENAQDDESRFHWRNDVKIIHREKATAFFHGANVYKLVIFVRTSIYFSWFFFFFFFCREKERAHVSKDGSDYEEGCIVSKGCKDFVSLLRHGPQTKVERGNARTHLF